MRYKKIAALIASAALFLGGCTFELNEEDVNGLLEKADELIDSLVTSETAEITEEKTTAAPEATEDETTPEETSAEETAVPEATAEETVDYFYEVTLTFRNERYLREHFEKHGAEFGYTTEQEYLDGANSVIVSPEALHKTEAEDGDDIYYIEATNEFVVVSADGYIRTYFRPSRGIDYYYAQ